MTLDGASVPLYALHYDEALSPVEIAEAHWRWGQKWSPVPPRPARRNRAVAGTPLRVGFLSQDFRGRHPIVFFLRPLLHHLDRSRFQPVLYSTSPSPISPSLRDLAETCLVHPHSDAATAARRIAASGTDVLIELCGHYPNSRVLICAHRPAPTQLSWLAYPNTSGLQAIDARLSDPIADPLDRPAALDALDPVHRLPGCFLTYEPPEACPPVSALPAFFQGSVTFGVFNNPAKITTRALACWARILHRLPSATLLFHHGFGAYEHPDGKDRLRILATLTQHGIPASRCRFIGAVPFHQGLELYGQADLALDTFPYNGTTTTCESLWMGLPVVHLAGTGHAARVTTSILHHAGMSNWIARTEEEYVDLAVAAASNLDLLANHRASARAILAASPFLDHAAFARSFEQALLDVVQATGTL